MPNKIDRTGEEIYNNQDLKMWIKEYRNYDDLDIEFEDGLIIYNRKYGSFKRGEIKNPNYKDSKAYKNKVGQTSYNNKGLKMEIVNYINNRDIDVRFDDNTIVYNKTYQSFRNGSIENPNFYKTRIGEHVILLKYGGYKAEIIKYNDARNISVLIHQTNEIIETSYDKFKRGEIKPKLYRIVQNEGCLGDEYVVCQQAYVRWHSMMDRCYSVKLKNRNCTYADCKACDEWKIFKNFKQWYDDNYYEIENERMHLDKDILVKGNKIYSPETCVFVPQKINTLFVKSNSNRGEYPIGVSKSRNKFEAYITKNNKKINLGHYNTQEEAFSIYKAEKEKYIKEMADKYKEVIPLTLYQAMYNYKVEIDD